jgi:hypothetical protein
MYSNFAREQLPTLFSIYFHTNALKYAGTAIDVLKYFYANKHPRWLSEAGARLSKYDTLT